MEQALIPTVGNLTQYINWAMAQPCLTLEQEEHYFNLYNAKKDLQAAKELIYSHLKLVVSIARQYYMVYRLPHEDLIQEGNIGLMKAIKGFDPSHGVRLSSYAARWIKAEIIEYVLDNIRQVKFATTKALKKAFFHLSRIKEQIRNSDDKELALQTATEEIGLCADDFREIESRLAEPLALNHLDSLYNGDEIDCLEYAKYPQLAYHEDPEYKTIVKEQSAQEKKVLETINTLDDKSRDIIQQRYLCEKPATLSELSKKYGVSLERIRQIEVKAINHLKSQFAQ